MVALTDDSLVEPKVVPMVEKSVDLMVAGLDYLKAVF